MNKQRAFASQEKEFQAQRFTRVMRALLLTIATLLTFVTVGLLAADQLYRPDTFVISQLKIKGTFRHLEPEQVRETLTEGELGNFFSVDLPAIKQKVESIPWVQRVDVRREWPNTLELFVVEHRPVMRWGRDKWVSSAGEVIALPASIELDKAIELNGQEADAKRLLQAAFNWRKRLAKSDLVLSSVSLSASQAWSLGIYFPERDNTFELRLGRRDIELRLARFESLFAQQFRHADSLLERVDARYPNGLAVLAKNTPQVSVSSVAAVTH
ncbi:cell division protein FtsQ/DivIB [Arenicella xantha]|uniref:Cell division protein FtsQ n=1 Tax=Arenicella xantha TaxID=644221 RepID=A0A395JJD2_9GAMM|nr:FtsQ-type POTRA domain-containing protein [Arenicella xantha]RBP49869.1 cell division protein FtsQ [Arenicella xantha]